MKFQPPTLLHTDTDYLPDHHYQSRVKHPQQEYELTLH